MAAAEDVSTGSAALKLSRPDFIIIGAMKSGTVSIHSLLDAHPQIMIPQGELHFFSLDDYEQHPDYFLRELSGGHRPYIWEQDKEWALERYRQLFADIPDDVLAGEDSTTYLASFRAAERIARYLPEVKLVVMLRDPVRRAYSHYWHNLNRGRTTVPFARAIHEDPLLLSRGMYRMQLERYLSYFPRDRIHIIVLENFSMNPQQVMDELCDFLGLTTQLDLRENRTHFHSTTLPRFPELQMLANWLSGPKVRSPRHFRLVEESMNHDRKLAALRRRLDPGNALRKIAYLGRRAHRVEMDQTARCYLEELYRSENRGLGEIVGLDLKRFWAWV